MANETEVEGQSTGAISFTVGDAQTPVGSLTVTASSSNTSLVTSSGIVFGGSGANRTITISPSAGQIGTTAITLTVTDGGGMTAQDTFLVTVNPPPNTAPTISTVANQTVTTRSIERPLRAIAITVGDAETPVGSLTLTGSSSISRIVASAALCWWFGCNRTVTITPVSGQTGTATITLTVTDGGGLTSSSTFTVTVNPVPNTAPTISTVVNQTVTTGQSTSALAITVGDAETPVGSLTLTGSSSNTSLVSSSGIVFGGSGANRTVTITPVSGQTGTATITLTVTDGAA